MKLEHKYKQFYIEYADPELVKIVYTQAAEFFNILKAFIKIKL